MRLYKESLGVILFIILTNIIVSDSLAQIRTKSHRMDRELNLSYDNDSYFGSDQYYTSGMHVTYSRHVKSQKWFYRKFSSKKSDSSKLIIRYSYGHKMFTPSNIKIKPEQVSKIDRPYAGWHYAALTTDNYPSPNSKNSYKITIGLLGEQSGIGNFQEWWHNAFRIKQPRGWRSQISNQAILNLQYNRLQSFQIYDKMDIITDSHVTFGNGANKIGQSALVRWGDPNPLNNTAIASSRLSNATPELTKADSQKDEFFLFYGFNAQYVFSDAFIQGSLFNDNSPITKDIKHLVYIQKIGFMYSHYFTTLALTSYSISREVVGAKIHRYISLDLALRF